MPTLKDRIDRLERGGGPEMPALFVAYPSTAPEDLQAAQERGDMVLSVVYVGPKERSHHAQPEDAR
ncbi:MAG: hypothetical protein U9Q81_16420 [Pseudomonadota bacterium]|nr:hypothetical protein [Pseudomonadota bacterium]